MEKLHLPYSYHTFLFPFIWNDNGAVDLEKFISLLQVDRHWFDINWEKEIRPECSVADFYAYKKAYFENYMVSQYFNNPARNLIFNTNDDVVKNFEFRYNGSPVSGKGKYFITKSIRKNGAVTVIKYELAVHGIKLKLFNTGVAVLIFELEYYGVKYINGEVVEKYTPDIADVNSINDYGRRINLPFIGESAIHPLVADKIELVIEGANPRDFTEDFSQTIINANNNCTIALSDTYVMDVIKNLITLDSNYKLTSNVNKKDNEKVFYICPVLDDRMFVCCLVRDPRLCDATFSNGEYKYLSDCYEEPDANDLSKILYEFIFIGLKCHSRSMRHKLLERCVYNRWIEMGTIYGITHHSFVCLTRGKEFMYDFVILPFLAEYVQLAIIAIVQRASIISLAREAAILSDHFDKNELNEAIINLQSKYVKFQNQILLFEVTSQEMGIEVFNMLREELYIEKETKLLESQLHNLYEIARSNSDKLKLFRDEENLRQDKKLSITLGVFAIASVLIAMIQTFCSVNNDQEIWHAASVVVLILLTIIGFSSIIIARTLTKRICGDHKPAGKYNKLRFLRFVINLLRK